MGTRINKQWKRGDKVKITIEFPDGDVTSYEGNIATVLVGDDTSTNGATFWNTNALGALNHINALTISCSNLIKVISGDLETGGGSNDN